MAKKKKAVRKMGQIQGKTSDILARLLAHRFFLQTVETTLHLGSRWKRLRDRALLAGWKALQLPNKRDQERTLQLINELHHRIAVLEAKAMLKKAPREVESPLHQARPMRVTRVTRPGSGADRVAALARRNPQ